MDDKAQELCNNVVNSVNRWFESYDWDADWIAYIEKLEKEE